MYLKVREKTAKKKNLNYAFACRGSRLVMGVQKRTITSLSIPQGIVYHQCEVLHIIKTLVLYIINPIVFDTHLKV